MNEKVRNFFIGFFTALTTAFGAILYCFRKSADEDRDRVEECQNRADKQQSDNREQQSNNTNAVSGIENALGIIQEIREKQQTVENNSCSSQ